MEILAEYFTAYQKRAKKKKGHKCRICNKIIQDGEMVRVHKVKKTEYYPVRGLMGFVSWHFDHKKCVGV